MNRQPSRKDATVRMTVLSHHPASGWDAELPAATDPARTLILVFGSAIPYREDPDPLRELSLAYPDATLAGCSTAGEILDTTVRDDSLTAAVIEFDTASVRQAAVPHGTAEHCAHDAGKQLAAELAAPDLAGMLVLSDGLHVNGSDLARGILEVLGPEVPVTGGLAADGDRFEQTWVLVDGKPTEGYISAIGFYGSSVRYRSGSRGGWNIFGPERLVTRSDGNVLYELDGRPALELYKQYLGDLAEDLPASGLLFPLAVRPASGDSHVVRTILAVDEETQSMVFAGDIPQGHRAQLMQTNVDGLVGGAEEAGAEAAPDTTDPVLAVAISCVGRRLVMGDRTEEEIEATMTSLPRGSLQVGFYSYGEMSPQRGGVCELHNQTMTLTVIGEDP